MGIIRILLVVPTFKYKQGYPVFLSLSDFPTGFAYLASTLKEAGHDVIGLNLNNIVGFDSAHDMIREMIHITLEEHFDLIGTGGLAGDYKFIKDAMGAIREETDTPIVLGGGIVTHDAEFIFKLLKPDFCIIGEAEEAIVQLANMVESGKNEFASIDNIGYWEEE